MVSEIEQCIKCGKKYQVSEMGGGMPGTKESEDITCPYCMNTIHRRSNGVFVTSPVSESKK